MTDSSSNSNAFHLPTTSIIRVAGKDAIKVLNGLCTAKLGSLTPGQSTEAFFTDERGRVLAHAIIALEPGDSGTCWIWGQFSQATALVTHIDRFIFREDATPRDMSQNFSAWLLDADQPHSARLISALATTEAGEFARLTIGATGLVQGWLGRWPMTSPHSLACLVPVELAETFAHSLPKYNLSLGDEREWQTRRIANFWPLEPSEISERTLPQELDRDSHAISFTKGCYLGQETVARLDALGEVQRKLCLVQLHGSPPQPGDKLVHSGKEVGQLTSVAPQPMEYQSNSDQATTSPRLALAAMRRGWMKPGSEFEVGGDQATPAAGHGIVIAHP